LRTKFYIQKDVEKILLKIGVDNKKMFIVGFVWVANSLRSSPQGFLLAILWMPLG
jgi:hypothetical protein